MSAEAPLFNTVAQTKILNVLALPQSPPLLSGTRHAYHLAQQVRANCTSGSSYPAPTLDWMVNGKKASSTHLTSYPTIRHKSGLQTAIIGLQFTLSRHHMVGQSLILSWPASPPCRRRSPASGRARGQRWSGIGRSPDIGPKDQN